MENRPGIKIQTPSFEAADKDEDMDVTISEAMAVGVPASEAESADLDDNGRLSSSEWEFVSVNDESAYDWVDSDTDSEAYGS